MCVCVCVLCREGLWQPERERGWAGSHRKEPWLNTGPAPSKERGISVHRPRGTNLQWHNRTVHKQHPWEVSGEALTDWRGWVGENKGLRIYLSLGAHQRWQERTSDVNIWTALLLTHIIGHIGNVQTLGPFHTDTNNTVHGLWFLIQHQHICNIVIVSSHHCWWKPVRRGPGTTVHRRGRVLKSNSCYVYSRSPTSFLALWSIIRCFPGNQSERRPD